MISGLARMMYEQKLEELNLDSLEQRQRVADIVTGHKIMHNQCELDPNHWFDKFNAERTTRAGSDPLNIKSRSGRLDLRKNFFSNRVVKKWNEILTGIKSIDETKKSLKLLSANGDGPNHPSKNMMASKNWQLGRWTT
jgi:hypothetical protein